MTRPHLNGLKLLLPLLAFAAEANAVPIPARVDVFVTSTVDITGLTWLRQRLPDSRIEVHTIDGIERAKHLLGQDLPADAESAERTALRRLQQLGQHQQDSLQHSADALVLAWHYRLRRYPAIVFDERWVVYGITDLADAYQMFAHSREEGGS